MKSLYNEYLMGAEREAAIIVAESDAQFAKLDILFETVDATLEANRLAAEAKVFAENGTYDDLTMLYTEAEQEAADKKQGILATIVNAIAGLFAKIGNFITGKFGKNVKDKIETMPAEDINVDKSLFDKYNIFKKGWDILKGSVEKIKSGNYDGIGDIAATWGPIVASFGAVAAGTATVALKRDKIVEQVVFIKDTVLSGVNTAINAARVALGVGAAQKALASATGGKTIPDQVIDKLKAAFDAIKKFGGWISGWLGQLYAALPFTKDEAKGATENKENTEETKTESVSIFGIEIDETFTESEMSDEEFDELTELFAEI